VDLELVCSSPPEFKGKSWKNCEEGCVDFNTEITHKMENVTMMTEPKLSVEDHGPSANSTESNSVETEFEGQNNEYDFSYVSISVVLTVTFICLLIVGVFFSRRLYVHLSRRKDSAESDSKVYHCEYRKLSLTGSSSGSRSVCRLFEVTSSTQDTQDKVTV